MRLAYIWPCPFCEYVGVSRRDFQRHKVDVHKGKATHRKFLFASGGNCKFCNKPFKRMCELKAHEARCFSNPDRIEYNSHSQSKESREKISKTAKMNKRSGGYRIGSGRGKRGYYKGYYCDSSWELAYVIYNIDHGIEFQRNHRKFPYIFEGEEHEFMPDWKIGNKYVEIKGYWTKQWQAKLDQFPKSEILEIITKNEIRPYLEYVENKYGKDFISLYENNENYRKKIKRKKIKRKKIKKSVVKIHKISKKELAKIQNELNNVNKDSSGRFNHSILPEKEWEHRRDLILNSGIDIKKFGWVSKIKNKTKLSQRVIEDTMIHFKDIFDGNYFRRSKRFG